ncbi:cholesterol 24-hydroxylase [Strongylocentrotus purpuratus]|uniref:Cholesterol 24-hydroxylase n=1 Tax=Strongylocentrotus purpuratus TaxID=7668 RepID=A0A7M7STR3_STRPU|nr:cholesterol 24-hydroxylase [Strongylocentrotus purpuratus]
MEGNLIVFGLCLLVTAFSFIFLGIFFYVSYNRNIYSHIPHPKPLHFLLGHLPLFKEVAKNGPVSKKMVEWSKELGPVYCLHIVFRTLIMCNDSTVIKELLTRSKYLKSPDNYRGLKSVYGAMTLGNGLLSEMNHEVWMKKRALFNPAFHRKYLMGLMNEFNSCSAKLVNHLIPLSDGQTEVVMLKEFERLTLEIIGKVGFGMEDDIIGNPDSPLCQLLPKVLSGVNSVYRRPLLKYSILPKDIKYKHEVRAAANEIRAVGRRCILARIDALRRGDQVPQDILTYILQESNNLEGIKDFDLEDMVDEFVTFFGAGQETTANLLSFTLLHLGRNPQVMKKLRDEIDTVLKGRNYVEYSDVGKMKYLTLVLKETLRINPPVGHLHRLLPHEMDICGYKVPKGSVVMVPIYGMGRNEKHFKNPEKFDPERFTRDEDSPLFAYMPFSLGARSCIGQTFTMIEFKVVICKLIQQLEFQLVPNQSFEFVEETLTFKPKDGCKSYITMRNI